MQISPIKRPLKPPRIEGYQYGLLSDRNNTIGNSLQLIETEAKPFLWMKFFGGTSAVPTDPLQEVSPDNPQTLTSLTSFDLFASGKNLIDVATQTYTTVGAKILKQIAVSNLPRNQDLVLSALIDATKVSQYVSQMRIELYNGSTWVTVVYNSLTTVAAGTSGIASMRFKVSDLLKQYTFNAIHLEVAIPSATLSGNVVVSNIQLEVGSTATSYEPYQGITITVTVPLKDTLGNQLEAMGIPATYNPDGSVATWAAQDYVFKDVDGKWKLRSNTILYALKETDISTYAYTGQTNVDMVYTGLFTDGDFVTARSYPPTKIIIDKASPVAWNSRDSVDNIGKFCANDESPTRIYFIFAKGTTPASVKAGLAGFKILYKNTTPVVTELSAADQTALNEAEAAGTFEGLTNISLSSEVGKVQVEQWSKAATR